MKKDKEIFQLIKEEKTRQKVGLELIASENYVSKDVLKAMGSILTNKYSEGYPNARYYGGCSVVDKIETEAQNRLKRLFGAEYANVQPHSGSQANAAVYSAFLKPGDKILGLDLSHGGHLTHGSAVSFSGKLYKTAFYGVDKQSGRIDYNKLQEIAEKERPNLIIAGASAYSRDIDFEKMRQIADSVSAILFADISHPAGLISKGLLNNPLPHCHVISSTTHKTLRGPRGGIIMMGKDFENTLGIKNAKGQNKLMSELLNSAVFPGQQGGPLQHIIAAKAIAFKEALSDEFLNYAIQVQKNAKAMEKTLKKLDYDMVSGGTDNHLILIDLRNKNITGKEAENALIKADITVNKNMVPFDSQSPNITSGIRIGTPAITTRGLKEKDMEVVIHLLDEAISHHKDDTKLEKIGAKVKKMMKNRKLFN